jgi:hypothetical protein
MRCRIGESEAVTSKKEEDALEGNDCRLISERARLRLSDEDVANQAEKTIKSPIG